MRIGINGYYLATQNSGIGQYTINLLRSLGEIDKENKYIIFTPFPVSVDLPENFKVKVITPLFIFPKTFFNRFLWEEYQLGRAIKKYHIEVFHGMYQSLPRETDTIGNVVTIHDATPWRFPFERKQYFYRKYSDIRKELVKKRAKKVITISETSKLDFASIYDITPEKIDVTYESVDPIFSHIPSQKEIDELKKKYAVTLPFILYTGGLKRHKNLRMLIKAFAILVEDYGFEGNLCILGAIRNTMAISTAVYYRVEDLQEYARLKKLEKRISFVGFVSKEEMNTFMHTASCFVSLSLYEGFGLPAVEAMTAGTPAVLSNLGAYPEIAEDAALFVYPYGPHRIANALHLALTDEELRDELIKKSKKRAKFFEPLAIAKRVLDIYKEEYDDYKISYQP